MISQQVQLNSLEIIMSTKLTALLSFILMTLAIGCASHEPNEGNFDSRDEARAFR